jgi:predicted transcriptional regulator
MKRSKEAIITKVLEICIDGASKTAIVYQANLNFHTVVTYINLLIDKGLLEKIDSRPITFKTTSNGIKLMEELESIRSKIPEIYNIQSTGKNLA